MGSAAPPLSVKLMKIFSSGLKDTPVLKQESSLDPKEGVHTMDALPESVDVGEYTFVFEIVLSDPEHKKIYATGGRTKVPIHVTGALKLFKTMLDEVEYGEGSKGNALLFLLPEELLFVCCLKVGMSLAQIGEFAFVLLSRASNLHLVEGKLYMLLLGTTALSLVTTPLLFKIIPGVKKSIIGFYINF